GRTYDHLCALFPGREIIVFERQPPKDPRIGPAEHKLILGDIVETLPAAMARFAAGVPLIHSDIGSGDSERNARMAAYLAGCLPGLLMPGGLIVSDLLLPGIDDMALAPPPGVAAGRYFLYRRD
ncbi:MAG TPA: class I SAM-dependent methyltransferase, partial [Kiloniellales bacterium]